MDMNRGIEPVANVKQNPQMMHVLDLVYMGRKERKFCHKRAGAYPIRAIFVSLQMLVFGRWEKFSHYQSEGRKPRIVGILIQLEIHSSHQIPKSKRGGMTRFIVNPFQPKKGIHE
jgi:hypothetical protein